LKKVQETQRKAGIYLSISGQAIYVTSSDLIDPQDAESEVCPLHHHAFTGKTPPLDCPSLLQFHCNLTNSPPYEASFSQGPQRFAASNQPWISPTAFRHSCCLKGDG